MIKGPHPRQSTSPQRATRPQTARHATSRQNYPPATKRRRPQRPPAQTAPSPQARRKTKARPRPQGPVSRNVVNQSYANEEYDASYYASQDNYSPYDNYQNTAAEYQPYQAYQRPRNTLGGDPFDYMQEKSEWTKWIAPVISGLVFIACVIILIILLT